MLILFDQATPVPIRRYLPRHKVFTAFERGWDTLRNGDLMDAAQAAGFEVFITTDRNIRYQQNLTGRKIAIIVLSRQQWPQVEPHVQIIVDANERAVAGVFIDLEIPAP